MTSFFSFFELNLKRRDTNIVCDTLLPCSFVEVELKAIYFGNESTICEVVILTGQSGHTPIRMLLGPAQLWDQSDLSLPRPDRITGAGQAFH